MVRPCGYVPRSNSHRTRRPAAVRVAPIRLTITARLTSGCPRQLRLMYEKSRCSIVFHLLVPGGKWLVVIVRPVRLASCCSSHFHRRSPLPLLPPASAQLGAGGVRAPRAPPQERPPRVVPAAVPRALGRRRGGAGARRGAARGGPGGAGGGPLAPPPQPAQPRASARPDLRAPAPT